MTDQILSNENERMNPDTGYRSEGSKDSLVRTRPFGRTTDLRGGRKGARKTH